MRGHTVHSPCKSGFTCGLQSRVQRFKSARRLHCELPCCHAQNRGTPGDSPRLVPGNALCRRYRKGPHSTAREAPRDARRDAYSRGQRIAGAAGSAHLARRTVGDLLRTYVRDLAGISAHPSSPGHRRRRLARGPRCGFRTAPRRARRGRHAPAADRKLGPREAGRGSRTVPRACMPRAFVHHAGRRPATCRLLDATRKGRRGSARDVRRRATAPEARTRGSTPGHLRLRRQKKQHARYMPVSKDCGDDATRRLLRSYLYIDRVVSVKRPRLPPS